MPPVHCDKKRRFCSAETSVTGQNSVYVNNKLVAVEGDKDDHSNRGDLIQQYGEGNIFINNIKIIVGPGDKALPDSIGIVQHPFSPTDPAEGSQDVFAYNGKSGGGLGSILGGNLNIGELVRVGGQLIGTVKNFTNMGGGQGQATIQNMGGTTPTAGQTLVGDDSGNSLVLTSFTRSEAYDYANTAPDYTPVMNVAITDDYGVIAMPEYFTGKPSQDYQSEFIVTT